MGTAAPLLESNPFGVKKYFWGNVQALDLLNLKQIEENADTRDFNLMFAGMNSSF